MKEHAICYFRDIQVYLPFFQLESGYLKHVFAVFERIGFTVGGPSMDWEVLWSHDYPFSSFSKDLSNLKPYQKVGYDRV